MDQAFFFLLRVNAYVYRSSGLFSDVLVCNSFSGRGEGSNGMLFCRAELIDVFCCFFLFNCSACLFFVLISISEFMPFLFFRSVHYYPASTLDTSTATKSKRFRFFPQRHDFE